VEHRVATGERGVEIFAGEDVTPDVLDAEVGEDARPGAREASHGMALLDEDLAQVLAEEARCTRDEDGCHYS
jgi:hypothetical protein